MTIKRSILVAVFSECGEAVPYDRTPDHWYWYDPLTREVQLLADIDDYEHVQKQVTLH